MQGRGRGNVAAERLCGVLFVGLTPLKGYFYINLGGTLYPGWVKRSKQKRSKDRLQSIPEMFRAQRQCAGSRYAGEDPGAKSQSGQRPPN